MGKTTSFRFVVQKHHASHLHYDFRLELGGVLKSWAVPKGPPSNASQKRLAVAVEDHPVSYIDFKGIIPKGNYGAGTVEIWDTGRFVPMDGTFNPLSGKKALADLKKGELKFQLKGKRLSGIFVLVRLHNDEKNWLLIKHKTADAAKPAHPKTISIQSAKKRSNFIHPMLATLHDQPFDNADWLFEIKWDGYRAMAEITPGKPPLLYSRNGLDFSERFKPVCDALKKIKHKSILDGEVVLLNSDGLPDFQSLQHYENHIDRPLIYYVFDLLQLDDKKTTQLPLTDRKLLLKKLLGSKKGPVRFCDHIEENGIRFLEQAKRKGLEGIIAKKKDSLYHPNKRSKDWLKLKNIKTTEALIAGYTNPKGSRKHFGALILGTRKGRKLQYRGHVGTGFTNELLKTLSHQMLPLQTTTSPFAQPIPVNDTVTWLKPLLVADIAYGSITKDHLFRHPVFLKWRNEKQAAALHEEITEEDNSLKKSQMKTVGRYKVPVTNTQKIFWPKSGYTKGEVIDYYENIATYILPHLKNRPLSLKRNPNGITDKGFYHKDAGNNAPPYVKVYPVKSGDDQKTIDYLVCNNTATLIYLANLGCIEINPWNSTTIHPDKPTWAVIDIDPSDDNQFTQVVDVALAVKQVLDEGGVTGYCKTSGATGMHIYIPLKNKYDYGTVKDFAHVIAALTNDLMPDITTLERSLKKRGPRIYLDYLQNRPGQTLAAAFSIRPVEGATVSMPVTWKEVNHHLRPQQFDLKNVLRRIKSKAHLFSGVLSNSTNIGKALKNWGL